MSKLRTFLGVDCAGYIPYGPAIVQVAQVKLGEKFGEWPEADYWRPTLPEGAPMICSAGYCFWPVSDLPDDFDPTTILPLQSDSFQGVR